MNFCIARKDSAVAARISERWPSPTLWDDRALVFRGLSLEYENQIDSSIWYDDQEEPQPLVGQALFLKIESLIQADHELVVMISKSSLGALYKWMGDSGLLPTDGIL